MLNEVSENIKKYKDLIFLTSFFVGVSLFFPQVIGENSIVFGYGGSNNSISPSPSLYSTTPTPTVVPEIPTPQETIEQEVPVEKKSSNKKITSFTLPRQVGDTVLSGTSRTIDIVMPFGTDISSLVPVIIFEGVSIQPAVGVPVDFTNSQVYTVVAEDGSRLDYTIRVMVTAKTPQLQENEWFQKDVQGADILRDGVIDNHDFDTLMTNWAKPTSGSRYNVADINKDHKVDIIDFNYIMVHWGKVESEP